MGYFSSAVLTKNITGKEVKKYLETIEKYASNTRGDFTFTRLLTISSLEKIKWVRETMKKNTNNNNNYHLSIKSNNDETPLPNLIIFDERYSFIFGEHFSAIDAKYLFINSKDVAKYFLEIYNQSWQKSIILQEGKNIYWNVLDSLEKKYS